jgi:O-antigen ligase
MSARPLVDSRRLAADQSSGAAWLQRLRLTLTLLAAGYMVLVGGSFAATGDYRVQLLNTVMGGAAALVWCAVRWHQRARLTAVGLELALALFALSQWLALVTSTQPRLGLEWAASVTAWACTLLILCDLLSSGWPRAFVVNALLFSAALITLHGLYEVTAWYAGWLAWATGPIPTYRLEGLGGPNVTAAAVNALLPLVLIRAARAPMAARVPLGALAAGMLVVNFFTSSRAGWLACVVTLASFAGLLMLSSGHRATIDGLVRGIRRTVPIARGLAVVLAVVVVGGVAWAVSRQAQHASHVPLLDSRWTFWTAAWEMFRLRPLTGAGPDLYAWLYPRWVPSPPGWLAGHAHSLPLQVLSGSGLLGVTALAALAGVLGRLLWRRWQASDDRPLSAALMAGLAGFGFHTLFDLLRDWPALLFIVTVLAALALTDTREQLHRPRPWPSAVLAAPLAACLGVFAFALRAAGFNAAGLQSAAATDWTTAARAFTRAAALDPAFTLYWEEAAYAQVRAGHPETALSLWERAARDDPYWSVPPATVAVLTEDATAMKAALDLSRAQHDLWTLNAAVLAEANGDEAAARAFYARTLELRPASGAALFWQQTSLRQSVLAEWQASQSADVSGLTLGRQALAAGDASQAIGYFEAMLAQDSTRLDAYAGLAQAQYQLGEEALAERYRQAGLRTQVVDLQQTLSLRLLGGDWARDRGDDPAAAAAYSGVFSAVYDYTVYGPATYGNPRRYWMVYHRAALPSDLVPQFARADITAAMDERFAWLVEWTAGQGNRNVACLIAERVWREAPRSLSGDLYRSLCE